MMKLRAAFCSGRKTGCHLCVLRVWRVGGCKTLIVNNNVSDLNKQ